MIQKFTVAWLLSLFVWNVALAGVPSLLLCLHDDFLVHLESEESSDAHCENTHAHEASDAVELCAIDDDCTDLKFVGSEQIASRLNEIETLDLPVFFMAALSYPLTALRVAEERAKLPSPSRAPPSVHWLTDLYIEKTVLRV